MSAERQITDYGVGVDVLIELRGGVL